MPAFRLLVDRDASSAFRHLGDAIPCEQLLRIDFEAKDSLEPIRTAVQRCNAALRTCVLLPAQNWKAMFFDMDSTVIREESIVELARAAGKEAEVAEITERAMAGELDFSAALRARVQLLAGTPAQVLDELAPLLTINPGMQRAATWAKERGIKLYLVSGGFRPLARFIVEKLGFDGFEASDLAIANGQLSGQLLGPIVDAAAKANFVAATCARLGIKTAEALAVGDGANDLPMLQLAGASIGYHPKPILFPHISGANFHDHSLLVHTIIND